MESLYLYFFPALVAIGLIFMRATDARGTIDAWTRADVLKFVFFGAIPGINIFLAMIMLWVVLVESEKYEQFRDWSKRDF